MAIKSIDKFRLDTDFSRLIYMLPSEEYIALEEETINSGCKRKIYAWNNTIISEYDLFNICREHSIKPDIAYIFATCREEAVVWICRNQLRRADIPDKMKKYLIGILSANERAISAHAASQMRVSGREQRCTAVTRYEETATAIRERIGQDYHLSYTSVAKYEVFSAATDMIFNVVPEFADKVLSGEISISLHCLEKMSYLTPEELKNTAKEILSGSDLSLIALYNLKSQFARGKRENPTIDNLIKKMPAYDPDAEIISLSLTVPSWVSSVKRVKNTSDISKVSTGAKLRLCRELAIISAVIDDMIKTLEE